MRRERKGGVRRAGGGYLCVQTTNPEEAHVHAVPPNPRGDPEDTGVWRKIMRATLELTEASEGWSGSDLDASVRFEPRL